MSGASASGNVIRKYLPVYFVLLAIFFLWRCSCRSAYPRLETLVVIFAFCWAVASATLGLLYFMHLGGGSGGIFC